MAKLKFKGTEVFKFHDAEQFKTVHPEAVIEVSDARAAKLKKDYPKFWEDTKEALSVGKVPQPAPAGKTPAVNKAAAPAVKK